MKRIYDDQLLSNTIHNPNLSNMFYKDFLKLFELFPLKKESLLLDKVFLYFIVSRKARVYTYSPSGNISFYNPIQLINHIKKDLSFKENKSFFTISI